MICNLTSFNGKRNQNIDINELSQMVEQFDTPIRSRTGPLWGRNALNLMSRSCLVLLWDIRVYCVTAVMVALLCRRNIHV